MAQWDVFGENIFFSIFSTCKVTRAVSMVYKTNRYAELFKASVSTNFPPTFNRERTQVDNEAYRYQYRNFFWAGNQWSCDVFAQWIPESWGHHRLRRHVVKYWRWTQQKDQVTIPSDILNIIYKPYWPCLPNFHIANCSRDFLRWSAVQ